MSKESSSSSDSKQASPPIDDSSLLKFYKRKYEEFQLKEDKYKERVDKHLKALAADRSELEEENVRRGDKIADLQKALVELQLSVFDERERYLRVSAENEQLKRNEVQLHENIRQLLASVKQQDLRDKIIYVLKNPKVEIGYRYDLSKDSDLAESKSATKKLKEELDHLNRQLDEVLRVSNSKKDVILEDCRRSLEKSKDKILQDEKEIKDLQRRVQRLEGQVKDKRSTSVSDNVAVAIQTSRSSDPEVEAKICSHLKDVHLSLILLTKVISKVIGILNAIQTTKLYQRTADIPSTPSDMEHLVEESAIHQLELCLRQCTRLAFDISNRQESLQKYISDNQRRIQNIDSIQSGLKELEKLMKEMRIKTADNDLLNTGLKRSSFFDALRDSSTKISTEDRVSHVDDFRKIVSNSEVLKKTVSKASVFVEEILRKCSLHENQQDIPQSIRSPSAPLLLQQKDPQEKLAAKSDSEVVSHKTKSNSQRDLENLLGIYRRTAKEAENLGLPAESLSQKIKATERKLHEEETQTSAEIMEDVTKSKCSKSQSDSEAVLRSIDKTLSKVSLMEQDPYLKDDEVCRKLASNVNALKEQFKQLTEEINVKSVQAEFSEYSALTMSKLEELAKQTRNSVIAAEAQISAHKSNAKHLSEKLKDTEELLRESINECLSLKKKLKHAEDQRDMEKYSVLFSLKEKLKEAGTSTQDLDQLLDEMTLDVPVQTSRSRSAERFVCMYCKQGSEHKLCEEKIRDLTAEVRKYKTQMKLQEREIHEERLTLKNSRSVAEKSVNDLTEKNRVLTDTVEELKKRTTSLLEQLKLERNRIKNMERFRRLEIEGFQTELKQLKNKIKDLEKQLMKAVVIFETNKKDMELLKTVQETAQRSKQAVASLRRLKAKLYELENDIKHL